MKRKYLWWALIPLVLLAGAYVAHATSRARPAARAQLLVVSTKGKAGEPEGQVAENLLSTQVAILRSQEVAQRAAASKRLQALPQFAGPDGWAYILASINVTREANQGVLDVEIHGVSGQAGVEVLEAVIEAYQQFLDETYRQVHDVAIERARLQRESWEQAVAKEQAALDAHRARTAGERESKMIEQVLAAAVDQAAKLRLQREQIRVRAEFIASSRTDDKLKEALHVRLAEWAARSGLDKEKATVDVYLESLRFESAELTRLLDAANDEIEAQRTALQAARRREEEEKSLVENVERRRRGLQQAADNLSDLQLRLADSVRVQAKVIYKPAAVK